MCPQTLTHKASAESCCDPQYLYLSALLDTSRGPLPVLGATSAPRMRPYTHCLCGSGAATIYSNLEIELIDVFLSEDMRRPEENLAAVNDFQLA
jgi:hypothetical protein